MDAADQAHGALAIDLEVHLSTEAMRAAGLEPYRLSAVSASHLYWTFAQMIAHHTCGGCNLQPGDLLGTGTISGPYRGSSGSLMEITQSGRMPLQLPGGEQRAFLENADRVVFIGRAQAEGFRSIGFGTCEGTISD